MSTAKRAIVAALCELEVSSTVPSLKRNGRALVIPSENHFTSPIKRTGRPVQPNPRQITRNAHSSLLRLGSSTSRSPSLFGSSTRQISVFPQLNTQRASWKRSMSTKSSGQGLEGDVETYTIKEGLKIVERFFDVPLDYSKPQGTKIRVFARHVIPKSKAKTPEEEEKLPFLVYLQGGPGFEIQLPRSSGYQGKIHEEGYQTLWLDQRGTGLSTVLSPETLPEHVKTDKEIAAYLKHFRADNIVRDCEHIRQQLLGHREKPEDRKWTIMGQSFGGFCAITYLSFSPEGLKEVLITGGLAPLVDQPDSVYGALVHKVIKRNIAYYAKYPQDINRVKTIIKHLQSSNVTLPSGGRLTPSRLQHLGMGFGMHGGIDSVHQAIFRASNDLEAFGKISYKTLQIIEGLQSLDGNPLYAILHEPIYCQGKAADWSACRTLQSYSQFSLENLDSSEDPIFFTGEMIFPDMFDDYANLRPWKNAAQILAQDANWPPLYDLEQLSKNEVKVSAVTYFNDMYVDFGFAQETASAIKNTEQYITNQLVHDGLRENADDVMKTLFKLSKREFD